MEEGGAKIVLNRGKVEEEKGDELFRVAGGGTGWGGLGGIGAGSLEKEEWCVSGGGGNEGVMKGNVNGEDDMVKYESDVCGSVEYVADCLVLKGWEKDG